MKQHTIFILETYEQLKVISDPLRTKMLIYLVEQPLTGQMLAKELNLSRAKVLYHLRELEKYGIIQLVKKEERGGNVLKYYQAVARGFIPADHLLTYVESKEATRQSHLEVIDRAKTRVLTAQDESFELQSTDIDEWNNLSLQTEFTVSRKKFVEFTRSYRELLKTLEEEAKDDLDKQHYYLMTTAFQIEELLFKKKE